MMENQAIAQLLGKEGYTSDIPQAQLMTYIDAAFIFYERVKGKGYRPTPKQTQALLAVAGVHESLERIKALGDIVIELEQEEEQS